MRIILIILAVLVLFAGCQSETTIPLDYSEGAFECELSWSVGGVNVRGVLSADIPKYDDVKRDVSLIVSEPRALGGAVIKRLGGIISVDMLDIEFKDVDMSGLLEIERLLDCRGDIIESDVTSLDGERVNRVILKDAWGGKKEIYLGSGSGYPVKICGEVCGEYVEARVIYFSPR